MELDICILTYVRSLREANYARWIPVHLRDMAQLPKTHPDIYEEFKAGHFTAQKTKQVFSVMPIDQAHEQNNACVKGDGGAVGLTENPSALRRWMIAGAEVARVIGEFEKSAIPENRRVDTHHHDQTASVQISFAKDVRSLLTVIEDMGNPFEQESQDLLVLDTQTLL